MYIRGKIDAFPKDKLIETHSSKLAVFLFDHGIIALKHDNTNGLYYYPKTKKIQKLVKKFAKEGGSIL